MVRISRYGQSLMTRLKGDERGLNTAELLGNAALAIVALIAIWAGLQALGVDVIERIRSLLFGQL